MVRTSPRKEVNVIFHINRCGLRKRCISAMAIFAVLLTTFILAQENTSRLHLDTSVFINVIDKTSATVEVQKTDETEIPKEDIMEEATETTENESVPKNDIVVQQKFMAIASQSVNNTVNLMSASDDVPHIYTSSKSIEEIIADISPQMDISKPSGISYEDFVFAIKHCEYDKYGYIYENVDVIWEECQKYHLNEFGITGIIAFEGGWIDPVEYPIAIGYRKNVMSVKDDNGIYKVYDTYADSIRDGIRLIAEEYIDENGKQATGGNLTDIGEKYAPENPLWPIKMAEGAEMATRALVNKED